MFIGQRLRLLKNLQKDLMLIYLAHQVEETGKSMDKYFEED